MLRENTLGLNYHGFVEGTDLCEGTVDVVVTDGFTGNVALKTAEGAAHFMKTLIKEAFKSSPLAMLGALLAGPALKATMRRIDPGESNGGPLLGLKGIVIKSHGSADVLSFHPEAGAHVHRTIQLIKSHGKKAGCVLNPATPLSAIENVLGDLDLVLVMSVNPGFGGQAFIESQLAKIAALRKAIDALGKPIDLEVDGGVNPETARRCIKAGADALVAGTAVFSGGPGKYAANIKALRS